MIALAINPVANPVGSGEFPRIPEGIIRLSPVFPTGGEPVFTLLMEGVANVRSETRLMCGPSIHAR
ncbi:hypothetical protein GCM10027160_09940 [Streptomyces calidiresistens]